jgi:Dolichyl-phosphate-mannose-protein mannosyltransferase
MIRIDDQRLSVAAACLASFALGLFFIFIWSPLPWGWKGIDFYYEIALSVARGAPFPTMHLVWGYVYFLAFWYRLFGDHQWIPLCVQALLNATVPLMLYHMVRLQLGPRVGATTAVLAGVFSFNTVYASTQASDSVCTVLVVAAMLCIAIGDARQRWTYFAAAGLVIGVAYQFRPNFVLFPPFVATVYLMTRPRSTRTLAHAVALLAVFVLAASPWVIRNYRWSGLFVPASTHGGVQFWFGTLQSGKYEDSWIYNPRAAFEYPPLDYSSMDEFPAIVTAKASPCDRSSARRVDLVYWTSVDRTPRRLTAVPAALGGPLVFTVPRQPTPAALYYFFDSRAVVDGLERTARTPYAGADAPMMTVLSRDHLRDLDVDGYVLDVFDIVRMVHHVYWGEPLPLADRLDLDADGTVTERDVRVAIALLLHDRAPAREAADEVTGIEREESAVGVSLRDGSALAVPRQWSGLVTDLPLRTVGVGSMAALLVSRSRPFNLLRAADTAADVQLDACLAVADVGVNRVPYRRLPHEMRRFTALALDNIRHDPAAYLWGSAHRALRVFVIEGSSDTRTAYQFNRAGVIYAIGRATSIVYLALFIAGLVIAVVRRRPIAMLLAPIVFVPLTLCFMLINARYSMTTQPFMFAFVAVGLVAAWDAVAEARRRRAAQSPR